MLEMVMMMNMVSLKRKRFTYALPRMGTHDCNASLLPTSRSNAPCCREEKCNDDMNQNDNGEDDDNDTKTKTKRAKREQLLGTESFRHCNNQCNSATVSATKQQCNNQCNKEKFKSQCNNAT